MTLIHSEIQIRSSVNVPWRTSDFCNRPHRKRNRPAWHSRIPGRSPASVHVRISSGPFPSTEIRKTAHPRPPRAKWPVKTAGRIFLFCLSVSARPSRTDCPDARPVCRTGAVVNAGNRRFRCKASDTPGTNQVIHTGSVPRPPSGLPQANAGLADAKPTGLARTAPLFLHTGKRTVPEGSGGVFRTHPPFQPAITFPCPANRIFCHTAPLSCRVPTAIK